MIAPGSTRLTLGAAAIGKISSHPDASCQLAPDLCFLASWTSDVIQCRCMSTGAHSSTGGSDSKTRLPEFASALIGTTLDGRFKIEKAIGQGAMGTVFAATQLSVNRRVAIKVLREQISETAKARFMREARSISSLSHPNIVQLIDFGERGGDGLLYLVMEYVEGVRMSRLMKKGRLHPNLAIEIVVQICGALAEAHAQGIVHRDLKPSNMLLVRTADGSLQVKVLDFGVAHTYEDADQLTATGVLCGTPAYMAPEQARGKDVTPRVDLYALGVNLYEMLTGFRPFRGATPVEVAMKQIQAEPPSVEHWINAEILPRPLVDLALALLRKDPVQRPQTATEVRQLALRVRTHFGWGPVVFPARGEDVWSNWTQAQLARHGGQPLDNEVSHNTSWSGSWSKNARDEKFVTAGSQAALHDAPVGPQSHRQLHPHSQPNSQQQPTGAASESMLRPATPNPAPATINPSFSDSLPSRHGGGWEAFRDIEPRDPMAGAPPPLPPQRAGAPSIGTATPSEETAHIVQVAQAVPSDADSPGELQVPSVADASAASPNLQGSPSNQSSSPEPGGQSTGQQSFVESTAASYEGLWQPTDSESASGEVQTFNDTQTLVADRTGRRQGTLVTDFEDDRASISDLVRFGLVVVLAFLVCAAIGYFLLYSPTETDTTENRGQPIDPMVEQPEQDEPEEAVTPKKTKRKKKDVELKNKKWREPIEVFDEAPVDDDPQRKIIVEEAD